MIVMRRSRGTRPGDLCQDRETGTGSGRKSMKYDQLPIHIVGPVVGALSLNWDRARSREGESRLVALCWATKHHEEVYCPRTKKVN